VRQGELRPSAPGGLSIATLSPGSGYFSFAGKRLFLVEDHVRFCVIKLNAKFTLLLHKLHRPTNKCLF